MEILITVEFITALFTSVYEIRYALFPEEDFSLGALGWGISLQVWMLLSAIIDILISATCKLAQQTRLCIGPAS